MNMYILFKMFVLCYFVILTCIFFDKINVLYLLYLNMSKQKAATKCKAKECAELATKKARMAHQLAVLRKLVKKKFNSRNVLGKDYKSPL